MRNFIITIAFISLIILFLQVPLGENSLYQDSAEAGGDALENKEASHLLTIKITSQPQRAEIFINNTLLGSTPDSIELLPGEYSITLKREGYKTHKDTIIITPDVEEKTYHLIPLYGNFRLSSEDNRIEDELVQKRIYQNNDEKIAQLHPDFQPIAKYFIELTYGMDFSDIGLPGYMVMITETYRSIERQDLLFRKGGVTMAIAGQSWHNYGLAIDVTAKNPDTGDTLWELPNNIKNKVATEFYQKLAVIGKDLGLIWGGDFISIVDMPHFEWHPDHIDIFSFIASLAENNEYDDIEYSYNNDDTLSSEDSDIFEAPEYPSIWSPYLTYTHWPAGDPWPFTHTEFKNEDITTQTSPLFPEIVWVEGGSLQVIVSDSKTKEDLNLLMEIDDFYIGTYPVTNGEFLQFFLSGGYENPQFWTARGWTWKLENEREMPTWWSPSEYYLSDPYSNHVDAPVVGINWYEAVAYCNWLSISKGLPKVYDANGQAKIEANGYRLPTEFEWEYVARKSERTEETLFPWGDEPPSFYMANYGTILEGTTPVGLYSDMGNPICVSDISGNVWEWCDDWYKEYFKENGKQIKEVLRNSYKVIRGGAWSSPAITLDGSYRNYNYPEYAYNVNIGFRVAINKED